MLRRQGTEQRTWKVLEAAALQLHAPPLQGLLFSTCSSPETSRHFFTYLIVDLKPELESLDLSQIPIFSTKLMLICFEKTPLTAHRITENLPYVTC